MIVNLMVSRGFRWFYRDHIYVKGYLFDRDNKLYKNEELLDYFSDIESEMDFKDRLINANGFFSVVVITSELILAAVDRLRSMPLFYGRDLIELYITDNPFYLYEKIPNKNFNDISRKEFILTGYVTGNKTLSDGVMQLRAGEYLVYSKFTAKEETKLYFQYTHDNFFNESDGNLIEKMDSLHLNVFKRLIKSLDDRMAVIPLSGGLDSRLIAIMLKRLGYTNVTCFSYGVPGNGESIISKEIAKALGFKWVFIEYSMKKWNDFFNSNTRVKYFRFSGGLSSLPHAQDFMAVEEMKNRGLIPNDAVFIPGHSYDFLQGSHIPKDIVNKKIFSDEEVIHQILKKHYSLHNWGKDKEILWEEFAERIKLNIGDSEMFSQEEAADVFELWDWQERQAKFICNSVRVYEYFNYEWRMPLWDNEVMEYWARVPIDKRMDRRLYYIYNDTFCSDYILLEGRLRQTGLRIADINYDKKNSAVKVVKKCIKKLFKMAGINKIDDIKEKANRQSNLKNCESLYYNNPLGCFGIMKIDEFREKYSGIEDLNSFVVRKWLKELEKGQ